MKKNKILLLTQYYAPDEMGTGKIMGEIFGSLADEYQINVISGKRTYKTNLLLKSEEIINGVRVRRLFSGYKNKDLWSGRLYNYIGFFFSVLKYLLFRKPHKKCDYIITTSNPPMLPLLAILFGHNKRKIYIIHDLYPDIAVKLGVIGGNNILAKIMQFINKVVFTRIDDIIVLSKEMKKYVEFNYNISVDKVKVIPNFFNEVAELNVLDRNDELIKIVYVVIYIIMKELNV